MTEQVSPVQAGFGHSTDAQADEGPDTVTKARAGIPRSVSAHVRPPSLVLQTAASPVVVAPTTRPRAASKNATDETGGTGAGVADGRTEDGVGLGPMAVGEVASTRPAVGVARPDGAGIEPTSVALGTDGPFGPAFGLAALHAASATSRVAAKTAPI
ncbi:MAG: hypothetical protein ABSD62_07260 [Candidatus Limnocylindrales bacterium]|jgi:hypothetical protein